MLRALQAYVAVISCANVHSVTRTISANVPIVQLRLSTIVVTVLLLMVALMMALFAYFNEPRDSCGKHITLPSSQLGWALVAAQCLSSGSNRIQCSSDPEVDLIRDIKLEVSREDGKWVMSIRSENLDMLETGA